MEKWKRHAEKYDYIVWGIRLLLLGSLIISVFIVSREVFGNAGMALNEKLNHVSGDLNMIPWTLLALGLTYLPNYIEKKNKINLPSLLEVAIVIFIYAALYLSNRFGLYYDARFFWWDDMLHTFSGVIVGFLGFLFVYKVNRKYSMNISPLLVAVFAFSFSITVGVLWEIVEFASDVFLKTGNQKWDFPADTIMMGRDYQGAGLRDTMSDLIVNTIGAFVTSVICFFLYKNEKKLTLRTLKKIFANEK